MQKLSNFATLNCSYFKVHKDVCKVIGFKEWFVWRNPGSKWKQLALWIRQIYRKEFKEPSRFLFLSNCSILHFCWKTTVRKCCRNANNCIYQEFCIIKLRLSKRRFSSTMQENRCFNLLSRFNEIFDSSQVLFY